MNNELKLFEQLLRSTIKTSQNRKNLKNEPKLCFSRGIIIKLQLKYP